MLTGDTESGSRLDTRAAVSTEGALSFFCRRQTRFRRVQAREQRESEQFTGVDASGCEARSVHLCAASLDTTRHTQYAGQRVDADVANRSRAFRTVAFKPVDAITAVRYDDLDKPKELQRPADFAALVMRLQTALAFDPASEGVSYFPDDDVEGWATNRVRIIDKSSFDAWMALEHTYARLPPVVVRPFIDDDHSL